mmetsp:Transcript_26485/g.69682  ORF Transcript_26485/g.69682 Transcript_26485/m.69682 type:complete len:235 (+) Transcript_26485:702-1406(+)
MCLDAAQHLGLVVLDAVSLRVKDPFCLLQHIEYDVLVPIMSGWRFGTDYCRKFGDVGGVTHLLGHEDLALLTELLAQLFTQVPSRTKELETRVENLSACKPNFQNDTVVHVLVPVVLAQCLLDPHCSSCTSLGSVKSRDYVVAIVVQDGASHSFDQRFYDRTHLHDHSKEVQNSKFFGQAREARHVRIEEGSAYRQICCHLVVNLFDKAQVVSSDVVVTLAYSLHHGLAKFALP